MAYRNDDNPNCVLQKICEGLAGNEDIVLIRATPIARHKNIFKNVHLPALNFRSAALLYDFVDKLPKDRPLLMQHSLFKGDFEVIGWDVKWTLKGVNDAGW